MKSKMGVSVSVRGLSFVLVLFVVTYCGVLALVSPLLLLLPISLSIYRRWIDYFLALWYHLPTSLLELVYGVRIRVCGDLEKVQGPCVIVLNHRTRFDWLFFWSYIIRMGSSSKHKIVLKESLKRVPGFGWGMQVSQFIFLSRNWTKDQQIMSDNLAYYYSRGYPVQLLFFPEGTDLSDSNRSKSHKYAKENGLPVYDYVLHPRTTGFVHCLNELQKGPTAPTIVNVTVGYVGDVPQNERDILAGLLPSEIHFCAETVSASDVPTTETAVTNWLKHTWQRKEETLKRFYSLSDREKAFNSPYRSETNFTRVRLLLALVFWAVLAAGFFYVLFTYQYAVWMVFLLSVFYIAMGTLGPGFDWLVLRLHQMTYQAKLFK